jgi:hypothetical protein
MASVGAAGTVALEAGSEPVEATADATDATDGTED